MTKPLSCIAVIVAFHPYYEGLAPDPTLFQRKFLRNPRKHTVIGIMRVLPDASRPKDHSAPRPRIGRSSLVGSGIWGRVSGLHRRYQAAPLVVVAKRRCTVAQLGFAPGSRQTRMPSSLFSGQP